MAEPAEDLSENRSANSGGTANLKPFQPGQSGNPGGRPKGLARKVREILGDDDGSAIAGFWTAVLSGELPTTITEVAADGTTSTKRVYVRVEMSDRIAVSKLLAERGWGKPPQFAPIDDADPLDFSEREADELAASFDARLDELALRRAAKPKPKKPS